MATLKLRKRAKKEASADAIDPMKAASKGMVKNLLISGLDPAQTEPERSNGPDVSHGCTDAINNIAGVDSAHGLPSVRR